MKNIRRILLFVSLWMGVLTAGAQSMSEQQIMEFVQKEMKAGTPEAQIAIKLMKRGVDVKQIQRLRQLNGGKSGSSFSSKSTRNTSSAAAELTSDSRLRESNGSVRVDAEGNPLYSSMDGYNPLGSSELEISNLDTRPNVYIKDSMNLLVNGKKVFGRDIFNKRTLSFEPNMNISTPTNYVLGPGDYVVVDIFGASQKSHNLEVSPDGTVTIEGFGPIKVGGLTVEAANQKIRERLGGRYTSSRIEMTVAQTRTITVSVMGEVAVPGTYTLSAFASVFHALYIAGGVNGVGTLRNIKVYRNGRQLTVVDVYDYILNGRLAGNIRLNDGDVIVVGPYECIVDITGQVKRPMAYEMKSNESVATLLKYAGGFGNKAFKKSLRLNRTAGERYSAYSVSEFEMADFHLLDGDSVTVDSIVERYENTVNVRGAVFYPGKYDLDGTNTIRSLIERSGGLTEEAFSAHALLYRMKEDRTRRVISIDVDGLMAGTVADIPLENEDDLYIPYRLETMSMRTLTIHGEVMFPGNYEYAENETIEDLILQAGGPTDATSTARVDVSRRINDPAATSSDKVIAQTFSFSLKNGYVVDGDKDFTLEPYDEVYVRKSPGYHPQRNIQVLGEVLFEGTYSLPIKNMRLSDAIKAAGGVTGEAYVRGARVERLLNPDEKFRVQNLMKMAQQQTGKGLDTTMVTRTDSIYYVGINLDKALEKPGSDYDIILREGDKLVVPEYNGTVKINGNVMYPNTVAYSEGKDYKWYINQAGGFGSHSKKSRTYILYQNGTVSKAKGGAKIEPGCEIIVPAKTKSATETISQIGSLGTTMATIVTLLVSVLNLVK